MIIVLEYNLKNLAPIILFTYNRPWHTRQTVTALQNNYLADRSELIVFSDAPKNSDAISAVNQVRQYLHTIQGFKSIQIIEQQENYGLAKSIIKGVTQIVNEYGRIIVLEDDLVTSAHFLEFMNLGLTTYESSSKVASIHGYIYPIKDLPETFFIRGADCWGWATWKDRWDIFEPNGERLLEQLLAKDLTKKFDFNNKYPYTKMLQAKISGRNDSWAIQWYASAFLNNMLTLYPGESYVKNIGHDSLGTHTKQETKNFDVDLCQNLNFKEIKIIEDKKARVKIEKYFRNLHHKRFIRKIVSIFYV